VSLDVGLPANGNRNSDIALGVEVCECPDKYGGTSCQDPSDGYYRWRNVTESTVLEELVGFVVPCECNGRSDTCDSETGKCQVISTIFVKN
jgi:laminin alpha 1/2